MAKGETEKRVPKCRSINNAAKSQGRQFTHHHISARPQSTTRTRLSTDSHFSQDDQERDHPSSFSHDTGSFPFSDAISSVDLTTWGPKVRRHNQGGRSMGPTDITAVVTTRGGVARASQVWQDGSTNDHLEEVAFTDATGSSATGVRSVQQLAETQQAARGARRKTSRG